MPKSLCSVCTSKQIQNKVIITSIKNKLSKFCHEYVPQFREQTESTNRSPSAFSRLLSLIFEDSNLKQQTILNCAHQKYSRYLRRKLKCDSQTFNELCNELLKKAAQRSYHLENLTLQIKGLSDTCLRLAQSPTTQILTLNPCKLEQPHTVPAILSTGDRTPQQLERNELKGSQQNLKTGMLQMGQMNAFMINCGSFQNYGVMCFTPRS